MDTQNFVSAPQVEMFERLMNADSGIHTFMFCHPPLAKNAEIQRDRAGATQVSGGTSASTYFIMVNYLTVQWVLERGNPIFVNTGHGCGNKIDHGVEYVLARHRVHEDESDYVGDVRWMTVDAED